MNTGEATKKWTLEKSRTADDEVLIKSPRGQYLEDRDSKVGVHRDTGSWQSWKVTKDGSSGTVNACRFL